MSDNIGRLDCSTLQYSDCEKLSHNFDLPLFFNMSKRFWAVFVRVSVMYKSDPGASRPKGAGSDAPEPEKP